MCEGRISTLLPSTESATLHRVSEVFRDDHREASDRVGAKRPGAQSTGFAVNLHVLFAGLLCLLSARNECWDSSGSSGQFERLSAWAAPTAHQHRSKRGDGRESPIFKQRLVSLPFVFVHSPSVVVGI